MTDEEVLVMLGTEPSDTTAAQFSRLTPEQVSRLTPEQVSRLTLEQFSWLTPEQVSRLTPEQFSAHEKFQARVPKIDKPYTALLAATNGCSSGFDMSMWHSCETTHCEAGWITKLAGPEGKALEYEFDTPTAARMILRKSCPLDWPMPNFYAPDDAAAAFIRAMAARERTL